jgi:predicted nucleotide-binding protein
LVGRHYDGRHRYSKRRTVMARGSQPESKHPAKLDSGQLQAGISRLTKVLDKVRQFDPQSVTHQYNIPHVERLSAAIDDALVRTFGAETVEYARYRHASDFGNGPHNYAFAVPIGEVQQSIARSRASNIALLEQAVEGLNERLAEAGPEPASDRHASAVSLVNLRKVFVVHGRQEGPREAVARFLERIGFEVVILHEKANEGRTVIEKVEAHSDVGFAVVLLTPDDEGGLKGDVPRPRARQNVLLELGYFLGKLSRKRVCTLKVGEVEIPSDWAGVIDEPFDAAGSWKQTLARELQAAGYEIDWNKVMRS